MNLNVAFLLFGGIGYILAGKSNVIVVLVIVRLFFASW